MIGRMIVIKHAERYISGKEKKSERSHKDDGTGESYDKDNVEGDYQVATKQVISDDEEEDAGEDDDVVAGEDDEVEKD